MSCEYFDCIHSHGCIEFKSDDCDCELCHNNYDACSYCKCYYEEKNIEKCLVKGVLSDNENCYDYSRSD